MNVLSSSSKYRPQRIGLGLFFVLLALAAFLVPPLAALTGMLYLGISSGVLALGVLGNEVTLSSRRTSSLKRAIESENADRARFLVDKLNADPDGVICDNFLWRAIQSRDLNRARFLVDKLNADPYGEIRKGALLYMLESGDFDGVRFLVDELNVGPEGADRNGAIRKAVLLHMLEIENLDGARFLVDKLRVDIEVADPEKRIRNAALRKALEIENLDGARFLVDKLNADPDGAIRKDAFQNALKSGDFDGVRFLVDTLRVDPEDADRNGAIRKAALQKALKSGDLGGVRFLVDELNVDPSGAIRNAAFRKALESGDFDGVRFLVDTLKVDIDVVDPEKTIRNAALRNALQNARGPQDFDTVHFLVTRLEADIDAADPGQKELLTSCTAYEAWCITDEDPQTKPATILSEPQWMPKKPYLYDDPNKAFAALREFLGVEEGGDLGFIERMPGGERLHAAIEGMRKIEEAQTIEQAIEGMIQLEKEATKCCAPETTSLENYVRDNKGKIQDKAIMSDIFQVVFESAMADPEFLAFESAMADLEFRKGLLNHVVGSLKLAMVDPSVYKKNMTLAKNVLLHNKDASIDDPETRKAWLKVLLVSAQKDDVDMVRSILKALDCGVVWSGKDLEVLRRICCNPLVKDMDIKKEIRIMYKFNQSLLELRAKKAPSASASASASASPSDVAAAAAIPQLVPKRPPQLASGVVHSQSKATQHAR